MALSEADWKRFQDMRREDRDHLDSVTEKLDQDSVRQWQLINKTITELERHKQESKGVHEQPCPTATALVLDHEKEKHNVAKTVGILAGIATIVGSLGALAFKIFHG